MSFYSNVLTALPPPETLAAMDSIEREILLAKVQAEIKRRKRANIEAALGLPDPVEWIENYCWDADKCSINGNNINYSRSHKIKLLDTQKRILRKVLTINPLTGRFPYRTIVKSKPKKQGKSGEAGFIVSYCAANLEPPNFFYVIAKDREQSSGRVYRSALPTLLHPELNGKHNGKYGIILPNGTEVRALTSDPEKEAGGSYGGTFWDELWSFKSDREKLLWDELKPVKTRKNSIRVVVTYAGFLDVSDLLYSLYGSVFANPDETEIMPDARPVAGLEDITTTDGKGNEIPVCWEVPKLGLFYENDHEQRATWEYEDETVDALSSDTSYYRHKYNRWQATENRFIEPDILELSRKPLLNTSRRMSFAIDAGWKHDCSAIVGVYRTSDYRYCTGFVKVWKPKEEADELGLDLDATIGDEIVRLYRKGMILRRDDSLLLPAEKKIIEKERLTPIDVWYDPREMHAVAMRLRTKHKILIAEFNQKTERLKSDSFLRLQYNNLKIDNIDDSDLFSHLGAAKAEAQMNPDNVDSVRITKGSGKHAKPIDIAVAQSMAVYRSSKRPKTMSVNGIAQGVSKKSWGKK